MTSTILHPALSQLLRDRAVAKVRRMYRSLRNPRKIVLSVIGLLLAFLWMGNAILSLMYREAYGLETLRSWIPVILGVYAFWHVLRVAWKRPEEAVEWTDAEQNLLCGGPFTRRELLRYRLTAVATATLFKALCASVLLMPELPIWPVGFLGLMLGLTFIELLRMALDILAFGASRRQYLAFRIGVFTLAAGLAGVGLISAGGLFFGPESERATSTVQVVLRSIDTLLEITRTAEGRVVLAPFLLCSKIITASDVVTFEFWRDLLSAMILVAATGWLVIWLDRHTQNAIVRNEREAFRRNPQRRAEACTADVSAIALPVVRSLSGVGPVFWRQWVALSKYKGELALALVAPLALSLLPLLQPLSPRATFLHVAAGLVFYSFVLLPPALKFDFRRDYERLGVLKMLPLRPLAVVVGQLAAPIVIVSLFQITLLSLTAAFRPIAPAMYVTALAVLLPLNVLIFGLENLIFLLAPHRLKQEGIEVFLRTMLVFTAKAVFFGIGLAFFFVWSSLAKSLSDALWQSFRVGIDSGVLFLAGTWIALGTAAYCTLDQLTRIFRRIAPAEDIG